VTPTGHDNNVFEQRSVHKRKMNLVVMYIINPGQVRGEVLSQYIYFNKIIVAIL